MNIFDECLEKVNKFEKLDWHKVKKALELGKLYQKYYNDYDNLTLNEEINIMKQIKELENE